MMLLLRNVVRGGGMTREDFACIITTLWRLRPFRPFTVELLTGQRVEVDRADALIYREGTAVFVGPGPAFYLFFHDSVTQIVEAPGS